MIRKNDCVKIINLNFFSGKIENVLVISRNFFTLLSAKGITGKFDVISKQIWRTSGWFFFNKDIQFHGITVEFEVALLYICPW